MTDALSIDFNQAKTPDEFLAIFSRLNADGEIQDGGEPPVAATPVIPMTEAPVVEPTPPVVGSTVPATLAVPPPETPPQTPVTGTEEVVGSVLTKDGKHVIPYEVLQTTRERAKRAETELLRMQTELETLRKLQGGVNPQGAAPTQISAPPVVPASAPTSALPPELDQLSEDFPTLVTAIRNLEKPQRDLEGRIAALEEMNRRLVEERANYQVQEVQSVIDSIPDLATMQASDPTAFKMAQQFDSVLRDQEAWRGRPLHDRFIVAVGMVHQAFGKTPSSSASPAPQPKPGTPATPATKPLSPQEMKTLAERAAQQAAAAAPYAPPTSLSQFPGEGSSTPPVDITELPLHQFAAAFDKMTTAQQAAVLGFQ